jgi:hypothetical protein
MIFLPFSHPPYAYYEQLQKILTIVYSLSNLGTVFAQAGRGVKKENETQKINFISFYLIFESYYGCADTRINQ